MALTERSRSALYQKLSDLLDEEEAVSQMLSYFPARDVDEPASKEHIDARLSQMEARLTEKFNEQMNAFNAQMRSTIQWTLGAMVALIGLVVAMGFLQSP